jgi:hypothetical protein
VKSRSRKEIEHSLDQIRKYPRHCLTIIASGTRR